MSQPPLLVTNNIAGKKVLRGTIEVEMCEDGLIEFPNVVINEVSSHYANDGFYLVVVNVSSK